VELKDGAQARSDEIIAFCRSHMAHFEVTEGSSARAAAKASMGKIQIVMLRPQAGDAVKR
jgi:fatty-acyl-CoA synthase